MRSGVRDDAVVAEVLFDEVSDGCGECASGEGVEADGGAYQEWGESMRVKRFGRIEWNAERGGLDFLDFQMDNEGETIQNAMYPTATMLAIVAFLIDSTDKQLRADVAHLVVGEPSFIEHPDKPGVYASAFPKIPIDSFLNGNRE
jgi:hypothetical protein